jgi:hypothetical protein
MSGFPPTGFHCVNLAIARVHQSARRRCRGLTALPALTIVDLA